MARFPGFDRFVDMSIPQWIKRADSVFAAMSVGSIRMADIQFEGVDYLYGICSGTCYFPEWDGVYSDIRLVSCCTNIFGEVIVFISRRGSMEQDIQDHSDSTGANMLIEYYWFLDK